MLHGRWYIFQLMALICLFLNIEIKTRKKKERKCDYLFIIVIIIYKD